MSRLLACSRYLSGRRLSGPLSSSFTHFPSGQPSARSFSSKAEGWFEGKVSQKLEPLMDQIKSGSEEMIESIKSGSEKLKESVRKCPQRAGYGYGLPEEDMKFVDPLSLEKLEKLAHLEKARESRNNRGMSNVKWGVSGLCAIWVYDRQYLKETQMKDLQDTVKEAATKKDVDAVRKKVELAATKREVDKLALKSEIESAIKAAKLEIESEIKKATESQKGSRCLGTKGL